MSADRQSPRSISVDRRDWVRFAVEGGAGIVTLNRPRAINALALEMIWLIGDQLAQWRDDDAVQLVILEGAGERGFCAGGDVRSLYDMLLAGRVADTEQYFRDEYALDATIAEYPKPVVALADGVTMGGGIGLAGHAGYRVVTERSRLAMPETRIGLTPDVGGSWLLAQTPGRVGEFLAITGESFGAADAIDLGFADVFVPSDLLPTLRAGLISDGLGALAEHAAQPPAGTILASRPLIDRVFDAPTVPEIRERLAAAADPRAAAVLTTLGELSPTAMTVTLEAVRRARGLPSLRDALEQEYGLVSWFANTQPDLTEGIRAQLVDKDRSPSWRPADVDLVALETVAEAFAFQPGRPLWGSGN